MGRKRTSAPRVAVAVTVAASVAVLGFVLLWMFSAGGVAVASDAETLTVAVMPFTEGDIREVSPYWWRQNRFDVMQGLQQMVIDELIDTGGFRVVERSRIREIIGEQDFQYGGRVDPASRVQINRLLGAHVLMFGTLVRLEVADAGEISIGPVTIKGTRATVHLTARMVDAETGEGLGNVKGEVSVIDPSFRLSDLGGLNFNMDAFRQSALGRAMAGAVRQLVENAKESLSPLEREDAGQGIEGQVLLVQGDKLVVGIGSNAGVAVRQRAQLYRMVDVPGLYQPVRMPIGTAIVISVEPHAAVLEIEAVDGRPKEGDLVVL